MSLKRLGYDAKYNDMSRDFQVGFHDPGHFHQVFSVRSKYRIGYFAWESSQPLHDGWKYGLDFCDEVWVPNECNARWAREWGYEGKLKVFPHGINRLYMEPVKRQSDRL